MSTPLVQYSFFLSCILRSCKSPRTDFPAKYILIFLSKSAQEVSVCYNSQIFYILILSVISHRAAPLSSQENYISHITLPSPGRMIVAKSCLMSRVARAQVLSVLPLDIRQLLA